MEPAVPWDKLAPSEEAGAALLELCSAQPLHVCGLRVLPECVAGPSVNSRSRRVPILSYLRALPCILPSPSWPGFWQSALWVPPPDNCLLFAP